MELICVNVLHSKAKGVMDCIAEQIVKIERKTKRRFTIRIDYSMSIEEMIAAGGYSSVDKDFGTKKFSINGNGIVEFEAFLIICGDEYAERMKIDEAIKRLWHMGLGPARDQHPGFRRSTLER